MSAQEKTSFVLVDQRVTNGMMFKSHSVVERLGSEDKACQQALADFPVPQGPNF